MKVLSLDKQLVLHCWGTYKKTVFLGDGKFEYDERLLEKEGVRSYIPKCRICGQKNTCYIILGPRGK